MPSVTAPNNAPASEAASDAPIARPASPRRAIGCPSIMVAAAVASSRDANENRRQISVVAVTETRPINSANACCAG